MYVDRERDSQAHRQTDRQRQRDTESDREKETATDRQTDTQTDRQTDRDRETQREIPALNCLPDKNDHTMYIYNQRLTVYLTRVTIRCVFITNG